MPLAHSSLARGTSRFPLSPLSPSSRPFASLSSSLLSSPSPPPSPSSSPSSLSSESWDGRLASLLQLAEAEEVVRRGKAVVALARGAKQGRRNPLAAAFPFSVDRLVSSDAPDNPTEEGDARLEALLAALTEEQKTKTRAEKLKLLVALARVRPQVLAELPSSEVLLRSLVSDLLGSGTALSEARSEDDDATAKEVLVVLGCVRRLMNLPPFASPTDPTYLRCCRLLREGRLALLSSSDLTKLLFLLARPFAPSRTSGASVTSEAEGEDGAEIASQEAAEEDAEALRRQLIVMALNVFSDRLEGASGAPPTLDDVASLLRAAALAGTHADVLRRVFACLSAVAAPSAEGEASTSLSAGASRRGKAPVARKRRGQSEKTRETLQVTPQQAIHLLHIMTTARLYSPEAIDALLSNFLGGADESAGVHTAEGPYLDAAGDVSALASLASPASLEPSRGALLNGRGASPAERILSFASRSEGGSKKGWSVRTLGTRSESLRLLKVVELTLRLDLPHTFSQLSPAALRVLGEIRDTPFVDPTLVTDSVLSYQLANFLRKHRFPCERSMEGPYALRLTDTERRLVVVPIDEGDEDPSLVYRHLASSLEGCGHGQDEGVRGEEQRERGRARDEAKPTSLLDTLRPETKARLAHLKELGCGQIAKAKFVRSLLHRNGLIDLAPPSVAASP
uniref:RAP domain-containing protein n=1 Tax=Neospora caninum (strain Liverpool) TaxID=572307 RepID=F0JB15_NEOCL|nr:hypothetical protein, conserved [Neospora caninum Liverpool]CEL71281.1 TPA: hypothetical protein, conserved [Neospora caninum Liverpool]